MDAKEKTDLIEWAKQSSATSRAQIAILILLGQIHSEIQWVRQATENEAVEDAEPDPFQTLNGPSQ